MIKKAIDKLKAEMNKEKNNPYIQVVGEYLLGLIEQNPLVSEKILADDKTIFNSLNEMKNTAAKKKVGNCAVLTDEEGFMVVSKYFGIEAPAATNKTTIKNLEPEKKNSAIDFDIKLEDLL